MSFNAICKNNILAKYSEFTVHMDCLTLCFAANILKVFDSSLSYSTCIKIQTWKKYDGPRGHGS